MKVRIPVEFVCDGWFSPDEDNDLVYSEESLGSLHGGTVFKGEIEMDSETAFEMSLALNKKRHPKFTLYKIEQ
jgi:hypothetical protein